MSSGRDWSRRDSRAERRRRARAKEGEFIETSEGLGEGE